MTDQSLMDMFAGYGNVVSASVIFDRNTRRSKGFGFVELEDDSAAAKAIEELNNKEIEGRTIVVSVARPKEER
ncbi:hypothetical protein A2619_02975 [candidate division WWE3 bacterium RIFOXYD1_FULL_39_9]|uniref:RRM domain-containing protein n=1 Tax=candidate division WWE3 bacterium RIFOXYD1_FULL_39_9 TaxID=1802649 RepID=A0A1F4X8M3_UNCKA|nr:MAG: hypothetical protein A2619_02975 [candidate division WWE3 bacterium RIFOXYD1_FULL_39_9]